MTGFERPDLIASIARVPAHLGADWTRSATLYIYPGEVGVRLHRNLLPRPEDGTIVRQIGGTVQLNFACLPPWFDTAMFIDSGSQQCVLGLPRWRRRQLLTALGAAGLRVHVRRRTIFTLYAR